MDLRAGNGTTSKNFLFGYNTGYGGNIYNYGGTTTAKQILYSNGNGYFAGDLNIVGAIKVGNSVGTLGQVIISDGTYGGNWGSLPTVATSSFTLITSLKKGVDSEYYYKSRTVTSGSLGSESSWTIIPED